jgi:hypothetical protein
MTPAWLNFVAHHRSARTARVSLLIPAIITAFAPVTAGLAMLVGWGKSVPTGHRDAVGRLTDEWDPSAFNEKGKILLAVAAAMFVCAGFVLLLRILERMRIQQSTPKVVEWICSAPHFVRQVVLEGRVVGGLAGSYAVAWSVPTIIAHSVNGEESELEISWDQVPFARHLLMMSLPPDRFSINLGR